MRHSCHSYSVLSLAHSSDRGVASGRNVRHFKTRIGIILGTICRKHPMRGRWHTLNFQNAFEVEFSAECITSLTICITVGEIILQKKYCRKCSKACFVFHLHWGSLWSFLSCMCAGWFGVASIGSRPAGWTGTGRLACAQSTLSLS